MINPNERFVFKSVPYTLSKHMWQIEFMSYSMNTLTNRLSRIIVEDDVVSCKAQEDGVDSKLETAWTVLGRRRRQPCRGAGALLFRKQWKGALFQALSGGQ